MADLKTDYKDDVLDTTQNTKRKYQMIDNGDGTVSFEDVTEYLQQGDSFGADDINDTNEEVNIINDKLNNIGDTTSYSNTVAGGSTNTWVDLISVPNLQNGVYMVTANVQCSKNLSSTLGSFSIAKNDNNPRTLRMKLESGGGGFLSYIFTINNANDAIKLKMYDNIDNTASYTAYMVICRIK